MALPEIEKRVKESFAEKTAAYSASADDFLGICSIDTADITEAAIDYEYYKCSLCTSEIAYKDYSTVCPECSSENTLQLRSYDTYKITMHIDPSSDSFFNNVFPKTENVKAVIADGAEGFYSLSDFNKLYDDVILYAEINRLTNQLKSLRFETVSNLSAGLEMSGAYEAYGNVDVGVTVKDRIIYNLSWPSVELDKHEITVEIGSSEVLKAKLTCDDPASYDVVWTSSDESVLTVDEKGYLKTKKIYGDSTVTAKFIFNGKEYQDSCLVHVGVPAEGVDLDKGKLSMKSGDTEQLNAVFNPKNTTNTVCYWYSEDESVAVVDENGNVTAVAKGNTVVYIISDYGNYYSSCKVEVTD